MSVKDKLMVQAIEWIACNDEPTILDVEALESLISVQLIADTFSVNPRKIAEAVLKIREA